MHRTLAIALLSLCLLGTVALPARAQDTSAVTTPVLAPVGVLGFVQLRGLAITATLTCSGAQCQVTLEQVYHIHNSDRVEGTTLRLGLIGPNQGASALDAGAGLALTDSRGTLLTPLENPDAFAAQWELPLARDEHRTVTLRFSQSLGASKLLWWRLALDGLAGWSDLGGLHVALTLPQTLDENILLSVAPAGYGFDRRVLTWDTEQTTVPEPISVQMIAPPVWTQLQSLRAASNHAGLARFLTALSAAGAQAGIALPDYADEILAHWQAAVQANPSDPTSRLELAQLYQERAAAQPSSQLNYMLLAGQHLKAVLELKPTDKALAERVRALYYEAASIASRAGDPASALDYLECAAATPGAASETLARLEELSLRWAVDLADQGMIDQALTQLAGRLAPETEDAILRYAPPFTSARTEIEQTPDGRTVRCYFELYPPAAERTVQHLQELATALTLQSFYPLQPVVQQAGNTVIYQLEVKANSPAEFRRVKEAILRATPPGEDLVAALLVHPWAGTLQNYEIQRGPVRSRSIYAEELDDALLQSAWDNQAEYVRWRMAELDKTPAPDEVAQLERRLALIALRDQHFIWDQLPASTYTVLRVTHWDADTGPSWVVPWGQARSLADTATTYHWTTIALLGGTLFAALILLLRAVAVRIARRHRA